MKRLIILVQHGIKQQIITNFWNWKFVSVCCTHPTKIDLNKKWLPMQKTIQNFNIDAQGFGKTRKENPPTQKIGVTS